MLNTTVNGRRKGKSPGKLESVHRRPSPKTEKKPFLKRLHPGDIRVSSELALRASMNYDRLEKSDFEPERLLNEKCNGWPGDKIGRTILGVVKLARATGREPVFLDKMMADLPKYLNKNGYFGKIQNIGYADEQQMGCHGWVLRAFAEYYQWKKDNSILCLLEPVVNNLLLPAKGSYAAYPLTLSDRLSKKHHWNLSSYDSDVDIADSVQHIMVDGHCDTGCAFLMLDGATHAYKLLRQKKLRDVIEIMIDRFSELNLLDIHAQTHASLTAARGILRFHGLHPENRYLDIAKKVFELYKTNAWTQAYGNYNWFGIPVWTELCAIVDSLMIAIRLWMYTLDWQYIEDAHHIYYNAFRHAQRSNGGFGTDSCLHGLERDLNVICYEAHWCCTMRGSDGLADVIGSSVFKNDNEIYIPFYNDCNLNLDFKDGNIKLVLDTDYPSQGNVRLRVIESNNIEKKKLHFYVPSWADSKSVKVKKNNVHHSMTKGLRSISVSTALKKGDTICFSFGNNFHVKDLVGTIQNKSLKTLRHGPMILGCDGRNTEQIGHDDSFDNIGSGSYLHIGTGVEVSPIGGINRFKKEGKGHRILFGM